MAIAETILETVQQWALSIHYESHAVLTLDGISGYPLISISPSIRMTRLESNNLLRG